MEGREGGGVVMGPGGPSKVSSQLLSKLQLPAFAYNKPEQNFDFFFYKKNLKNIIG